MEIIRKVLKVERGEKKDCKKKDSVGWKFWSREENDKIHRKKRNSSGKEKKKEGEEIKI